MPHVAEVVYDPYDPSTRDDPYPVYAAMRASAPVYRSREHGFFALSRYVDVLAAAQDPMTYSSEGGITITPGESEVLLPMLITTDPPRHTKLRKLVSGGFTPRRMARLEESVRTIAAECMATVSERDAFDVYADLAAPVPTTVIADLLGVPRDDREQFRRWSDALVRASGEQVVGEEILALLAEMYAYLEDVARARRRQPRDDLISVIVHAETDGHRLSREEVLGFCFLLLVAGNETTTNLITNSVTLLAEHATQRRAITADRSRIPDAVEEVLRFESPVQGLARTLTRDVTLHGVHMAEGSKVLLLWGSANRDVALCSDPDVFDIARGRVPHLAFGSGSHFCLGASLARLETRVVIEEFLQRVPDYAVLPDSERLPSALVRGFRPLRVAPVSGLDP